MNKLLLVITIFFTLLSITEKVIAKEPSQKLMEGTKAYLERSSRELPLRLSSGGHPLTIQGVGITLIERSSKGKNVSLVYVLDGLENEIPFKDFWFLVRDSFKYESCHSPMSAPFLVEAGAWMHINRGFNANLSFFSKGVFLGEVPVNTKTCQISTGEAL